MFIVSYPILFGAACHTNSYIHAMNFVPKHHLSCFRTDETNSINSQSVSLSLEAANGRSMEFNNPCSRAH